MNVFWSDQPSACSDEPGRELSQIVGDIRDGLQANKYSSRWCFNATVHSIPLVQSKRRFVDPVRALLQVRFYDESAAFGIDPNDNMTPANTATKALSPNVNVGPLKDQNMPAAALATKVAPPTANS